MSILNTSPVTDELLRSRRSNPTGVPNPSTIAKPLPSQTLKREIGHEGTRGGSSKRKLTLRKEGICDPTDRDDLSHDLHIRESAAILGQVCHDVRQPVVALLACVELLTESMGTAITEEQKELIASMQASSRCMLELVDDSLALAFAAAGTLDFEPALIVAMAEQNSAENGPVTDRRPTHSELRRKR
jgi:signal transduction histidine kinase